MAPDPHAPDGQGVLGFDARDAALAQRLVDLETRIAFQEHALGELSDALAAARDENTRTLLVLHQVVEELKHVRSTLAGAPLTADRASEPPPPHY